MEISWTGTSVTTGCAYISEEGEYTKWHSDHTCEEERPALCEITYAGKHIYVVAAMIVGMD